jgi:hypothetical protein
MEDPHPKFPNPGMHISVGQVKVPVFLPPLLEALASSGAQREREFKAVLQHGAGRAGGFIGFDVR